MDHHFSLHVSDTEQELEHMTSELEDMISVGSEAPLIHHVLEVFNQESVK